MSQLLSKNVAEIIEKRLCGEISSKQLSDWAWEVHWKDETDPFLFKEKNPEVLWDVISALAQSDTEGFELEEYQLREFLQKLWLRPIY